VQAPDAEPGKKKERRPYHLSLVIDRSGSMSGEPLVEAVRCARHIVDRLDVTDVASLVVFDDRVKTLTPARPVGDRSVLYAALAGNANAGDTIETSAIAACCAEAAERGVSTSTYGLGHDFNEELMVEMARRGNANHYYGDTPTDLFEPFAEEFDFISKLYARHVRLALTVPPGVKITLINDYPLEAREGFPLICLPDVPFGAEACRPCDRHHISVLHLLRCVGIVSRNLRSLERSSGFDRLGANIVA
jgi:Ca-activated chloride channel family protein